MVSSFTPVAVTDPAKERDWAYQIGRLDWDDTKIVFTKRTLLEFLRYTGTSVDTNMSNISKLPRYCQFGKITDSDGDVPAVTTATAEAEAPDSAAAPVSNDPNFKPTRRVREAPGGKQSINLFDGEFEDDALSTAPTASSLVAAAEASHVSAPTGQDGSQETDPADHIQRSAIEGFVPTRRVREAPGGKDNIGSILGY